MARPRGRPATRGETQLFSLRLPVDLHAELRIYALSQRKPLNELLVEVIADWWKHNPDAKAVKRLVEK